MEIQNLEKGKWCLITGSNRGLGWLATEYMASLGFNIIMHGRSLDSVANKANDIKSRYGVDVLTYCCRLDDSKDIERMLDDMERDNAPLPDVILNNAGVQVTYRTDYYTTPVEDFGFSLQVNTTAPMQIIYRLLPKMIERGSGAIVNTTSGIDKEPEQAPYSASKAALDKITKDLSTKLTGTGVSLNLVDPGWCRTDLGGPNAPNSPESALPGIVLGAFTDDSFQGNIIRAQEYSGMDLEKAMEKLLS